MSWRADEHSHGRSGEAYGGPGDARGPSGRGGDGTAPLGFMRSRAAESGPGYAGRGRGREEEDRWSRRDDRRGYDYDYSRGNHDYDYSRGGHDYDYSRGGHDYGYDRRAHDGYDRERERDAGRYSRSEYGQGSPRYRDDRRDRPGERLYDRDGGREREYARRRQSRSPPSRRSRSPPPSSARSAGKAAQHAERGQGEPRGHGKRARSPPDSGSSQARKGKDGAALVAAKSKAKARDAADVAEVGSAAEDDGNDALAAMLGISGFGSTKGKHIEGQLEGAKVKKEHTWRQYMNRKGGFNRVLDKI